MMSRLPVSPVRSEINVTPLVDVCLVLLIIFMVVTPLLGKAGSLELPRTSAPQMMPEERDQLTVTLDREGKLYVGEVPVPEAHLAEILSDKVRKPGQRIAVRADRGLSYEQVRHLLEVLRAAGFDDVGLVTTRFGSTP